jgi:hypothetical protein
MFLRLRVILNTWPFVAAVILLLLNDWWLKHQYPNLITGKLSDFSGIFVVTILLISAFPKHIAKVFFSVTLLFIWWKSPASQNVINLFNSIGFSPINRVVDYTDLAALTMLPLAKAVFDRQLKFTLKIQKLEKTFSRAILLLSWFAISASTCINPDQIYRNEYRNRIYAKVKQVAKIEHLIEIERKEFSRLTPFTDGEFLLQCRFNEPIRNGIFICEYSLASSNNLPVGDNIASRGDGIKKFLMQELPEIELIDLRAQKK